jgi:hypothetical protein
MLFQGPLGCPEDGSNPGSGIDTVVVDSANPSQHVVGFHVAIVVN